MDEVEKEVLEILKKFMFEDNCDKYYCHECGFQNICKQIYIKLDSERDIY